ncbi:hypothetical protein H1P_10081 [Hyella patelloides LEGE 07179]|uniref:Uncharacterized protein n=1 Tax=Hyella patelloides LEGE 07179 TaxID=945734 RepID=A0A563VIM0_9CYAN|nr:hypothetical protein [Hyella patelloides]VEP11296.1 hypothetical protein H1P_10081 [Hyella patelloides LEGE 07179]
MNYDLFEIKLKSSENNYLSWYTIERALTKEGRFIRQSSGTNSFAIITLKIEPITNKQIAIFANKIAKINLGYNILYPLQQKDSETSDILQTINSGVILGIEAACLNLEPPDCKDSGLPKHYGISGIKVTALKALFHPIDSHSRAFKMATKSVLLAAFQEVKLIKI